MASPDSKFSGDSFSPDTLQTPERRENAIWNALSLPSMASFIYTWDVPLGFCHRYLGGHSAFSSFSMHHDWAHTWPRGSCQSRSEAVVLRRKAQLFTFNIPLVLTTFLPASFFFIVVPSAWNSDCESPSLPPLPCDCNGPDTGQEGYRESQWKKES